MTASALLRQATFWSAVILVGVGLGGAVSLLGYGDGGMIVGGFALVTAGAFVGAMARWKNMQNNIRGRYGAPPELFGSRTPLLFRIVTTGFLGLGILIGSMLGASPILLIVGAAGVIAVTLMRAPQST
jgi:hypothetical protein